MTYRDDVEALAQRCRTLEADVSASRRELEEARRLLDEARTRHKLPVLDGIRIAAPCHADWDHMKGDDRSRFCKSCEKNVYNLSSMTRVEAEGLLIEKEGKLCVRYYQRADGTILTTDCPVGVTKRRRKIRIIAAGFGALSAVAAAADSLLMMGAPRRPPPPMGRIAMDHSPGPAPIDRVMPTMGEPAMQMMGDPSVSRMMGSVSVPRTQKVMHPRPAKPTAEPVRLMGKPSLGALELEE